MLILIFSLIVLLCLVGISWAGLHDQNGQLQQELDNAKKHEEFLNSVIKSRGETIDALTDLIRVKSNELAWYRNATNGDLNMAGAIAFALTVDDPND